MKLDVRPNIGVGALLFGMPRASVRSIIGSPFREFGRNGVSAIDSDQYRGTGIHAHFDANDRLEALEFAEPAKPMLTGQNLLALDMSEARALCRASGGAIHDHPDGPISRALGLGFWSPDAHEDAKAPVEAVIAFGPGYFERYSS